MQIKRYAGDGEIFIFCIIVIFDEPETLVVIKAVYQLKMPDTITRIGQFCLYRVNQIFNPPQALITCPVT